VTSGQITAQEASIRSDGVQASGVVLASRPTGQIADGMAVIDLQVQVTRPDGTTFQAEKTQAAAQEEVPFTVPGSVVRVFYPPYDERDVVFELYAWFNG